MIKRILMILGLVFIPVYCFTIHVVVWIIMGDRVKNPAQLYIEGYTKILGE